MRRLLAALSALATVGGCYDPQIADGQYTCYLGGGDKACPNSFYCDPCGRCVAQGHAATSCDDGGLPDFSGDLATCTQHPCYTDGCSQPSKRRAASDPDLVGVAFCDATWRVPGITTNGSFTTPCNRNPGNDGQDPDGKIDCSVEDNCAAGFHVCRSDQDLVDHGLTAAHCSGAGSAGFWATRQGGGMSSNCASGGVDNIIGCGTGASSAPIVGGGCTVEQRLMNHTSCSMTNGVWSCGSLMNQFDESTVVTKGDLRLGGVICCRD